MTIFIFLIGIHSMQDLNSYYKAWSYNEKKYKKIEANSKSV